MSPLHLAVEAALSQVVGRAVRIASRAPLGGGSICQTERIYTAAGAFVLKSLPGAQTPETTSRQFEAEAHGLEALRRSSTALTVPAVIAWASTAPAFLILEYLSPARPVEDFDDRLGVGLAELHRATSPRYGFDADNFCGATTQPNHWALGWLDFYRTRRLGHQLRLARDHGAVSAAESARVESVIAHLDRWIDEPPEGPALIHGDLWSGNLIADSQGRPSLIDPAASYAHREAELGMMTLFGGFAPSVFDAYDSAFPLDNGWQERNPLYQLYHLLNHLNLFGGGYHHQVMEAVGRYA